MYAISTHQPSGCGGGGGGGGGRGGGIIQRQMGGRRGQGHHTGSTQGCGMDVLRVLLVFEHHDGAGQRAPVGGGRDVGGPCGGAPAGAVACTRNAHWCEATRTRAKNQERGGTRGGSGCSSAPVTTISPTRDRGHVQAAFPPRFRQAVAEHDLREVSSEGRPQFAQLLLAPVAEAFDPPAHEESHLFVYAGQRAYAGQCAHGGSHRPAW